MDMVLYDSGPGDDRLILMGCAELLDGLARADLWLADGTFKVVPNVFFRLNVARLTVALLSVAAVNCRSG